MRYDLALGASQCAAMRVRLRRDFLGETRMAPWAYALLTGIMGTGDVAKGIVASEKVSLRCSVDAPVGFGMLSRSKVFMVCAAAGQSGVVMYSSSAPMTVSNNMSPKIGSSMS